MSTYMLQCKNWNMNAQNFITACAANLQWFKR